jgi:putative spermidine/putrescine transport system ATP-binding protein
VALVRPESLTVEPDDQGNARVTSVAFLGSISRVYARLDDGQELMAQVPSGLGARLAPQDGIRVAVEPNPVLVVAD